MEGIEIFDFFYVSVSQEMFLRIEIPLQKNTSFFSSLEHLKSM